MMMVMRRRMRIRMRQMILDEDDDHDDKGLRMGTRIAIMDRDDSKKQVLGAHVVVTWYCNPQVPLLFQRDVAGIIVFTDT